MVALNSVVIAGNLGDNPEIRFTKNSTPVANFTVAHTPRSFDKNTNQWEDGETLWLRVTAWGGLAENVAESLTKGMRVVVTGRLEANNWETEEGERRSSIQMVAEEVAPSLTFATAKVEKNEAKKEAPAKKTVTRSRR